MSDTPNAPEAPDEGSGLRMATPDGGSVPIADVIAAPDAPEDAPDEAPAEPHAHDPAPSAPPPGHVPVAALHEEREKRRRIEGQASQLASALHAHPDIVAELDRRSRGESPKPLGQTAHAAPAKHEYPADMLESVAKDFGLYKADGSGHYDFEAAGRMLGYMDRVSTERARGLVQPLMEARRNDAVSAARAQMASEAQQQGVDVGTASAVFDAIAQADPELATHPAVRQVINIFSRGLQGSVAPAQTPAAQARPTVPPVGEVRIPATGVTPNFRAANFTEPGTGRSTTPPDIPRLAERAAKIAGVKISPADFDRAGKALASGTPYTFRHDED